MQGQNSSFKKHLNSCFINNDFIRSQIEFIVKHATSFRQWKEIITMIEEEEYFVSKQSIQSLIKYSM